MWTLYCTVVYKNYLYTLWQKFLKQVFDFAISNSATVHTINCIMLLKILQNLALNHFQFHSVLTPIFVKKFPNLVPDTQSIRFAAKIVKFGQLCVKL